MQVYYAPTHSDAFRPVSSPGDIAGSTGRLRIVRDGDDDQAAAKWAPAIGAFVLRGSTAEAVRR